MLTSHAIPSLGFDPFETLGPDLNDSRLTFEDLTITRYCRAVRHVFRDRPGMLGLTSPTHGQVNEAKDYFLRHRAQLRELRETWATQHRSTWNPSAPLGSDAARRSDPSHRPPPMPRMDSNVFSRASWVPGPDPDQSYQ